MFARLAALPLTDFNESIATEASVGKLELAQVNEARLEALSAKISPALDPFQLVQADLEYTKNFALENILQTKYGELEKASHYNLLLKGKNFRSAILFLLAKSIYYSEARAAAAGMPNTVTRPFEQTEYYQKVACLAACIEIAHNASLL